MLTFKEQKLKEFREKYNYTSFTWNGDVFDGEKIAKQTRREVIAFLSSTIDEAEKAAFEREQIFLIGLLEEVLIDTIGEERTNLNILKIKRTYLAKLGGVKE